MKAINKYIALLLVHLLSISSVKSQSGDECKYLTILTYLRTNSQVNEKIKMVFPGYFKKKEKYIEFNLSATITFVGILDFGDRLKKYASSDSLLNDRNKYYNKYIFYPFKSDFLKNIMEQNDSKLFLTLSKPLNDFLLVEITSFNPELYGGRKFGKGIDIFFKFNAMGIVESAEYAGAAYN